MTLSKVFSVLALSFIAGVFFSVPGILLGFLIPFFFYYLYRSRVLSVFSLLFFLFGALCFLSAESFSPSLQVPFEGSVTSIEKKGDRSEIAVSLDRFSVLLFLDRHTPYTHGDLLRVDCDLRKPSPSYYERYLRKEGIYYICYYPQIEVVDREESFYTYLFNLREVFKERMHRAISPPQVFLLEAMTMGDRTSFSDELNEKLSIAGVRHITAVSGMHIVIVSSLLFSLFTFFFSRRYASLASIVFIVLFVFFVGAPASAVRAGVMGSLLLFSKAINSTAFSLRSLIFAAALMLFFNPLLVYDVGFHLSFLAVLGIILLFPLLKEGFTTLPLEVKEGWLFSVRRVVVRLLEKRERLCDMICVTLSATLFTAPLIIYNFGNFPLFTVVSNLLIVPLLPFIFVFGVIGALTASSLLAFPAQLLLSFVFWVIETVSLLPFAALQITGVSPFFVFILYLFVLYYINKRNKLAI